MDPVDRHAHEPDASFDGGGLDCGGGLLLLIRRHIDPLEPGSLLEILSTDSTVEVELPAWCRLTGNDLVSWTRTGERRSYLVSKGPYSGVGRGRAQAVPAVRPPASMSRYPARCPVPPPLPGSRPSR